MRTTFTIILVCFYSVSFSQSFTERDIKELAKTINDKLQGTELSGGMSIRGCYAIGRTLVYQYDVTEDWYATENMKEELIANFKEGGLSKTYFNSEINVDFLYYYGSTLRKRISINSKEFSPLAFSLGEYISIIDHPKAKDVNLKLKKPIGWEIKEGDRPNIIFMFVYNTNTYSILTKDNAMFISRSEAKDLLNDEEYVEEFITETSSFLRNPETLNHRLITIDSYPCLEFTIRGNMERSGFDMKLITKNWIIFYEDKLVILQCGGLEGKEFDALISLYDSITSSVIFPDQYN